MSKIDWRLFNIWSVESTNLLMYPKCLAKSTHWSRLGHIYVGNLTIIGWDNWTLRNKPNLSENLIEILTFSFKKVRLKVSSLIWRLPCLSRNMLNTYLSTKPLEGFPVVWDLPGKSHFVTTLLIGCTGLRSMKLLLWHANCMLITVIKSLSFLFIP